MRHIGGARYTALPMFEDPVHGLAVGAVLGAVLGTVFRRHLLKHLEERSGIPFLKQYTANKARGSQFKWIVLNDFGILMLVAIAVAGLYSALR